MLLNLILKNNQEDNITPCSQIKLFKISCYRKNCIANAMTYAGICAAAF